MMVASGAVFVFALTPDVSEKLRAALDEISAMRHVSLSDYPGFVRGRVRHQEDENYQFLLRVVRSLGLPVRGQPQFTYSFLCDPPPQGDMRLVDYEAFLSGNHRAASLVIDQDVRQVREALKTALGNLRPPPFLVGIHVSTPADSMLMYPGNVRIWEWGQLGNAATVITSVTFYFSYLKGQPPNIPPIPVAFKVGEIESGPLALDWLRSDVFGRQLLDQKSGRVFPNLKQFWGRVGLMNLDGATVFLEDQLESDRRGSLSLFGISVDRSLLTWVGPSLCLSLMLFFVLHLRHMPLTSAGDLPGVGEAARYPWVICFSDRASGIVGYCTLFVPPLGANLLLLLNHGNRREASTWLGWMMLMGYTIAASFGVRYTYRFRSGLRNSSAGHQTAGPKP
jgi:hypothetical protein